MLAERAQIGYPRRVAGDADAEAMSADFGLIYHLWSFAGTPGELLDRVVGEVALNRLVVPVVTGAVTQFRLDTSVSPQLFHTEGGWHYPPDPAIYRGSSVRPRAARWFGKRHTLEHLADFAARRDLKLVCRVDLCGAPSLIEHEPHLRQRNAWGDEDLSAGACVLNPDLREVLTSVVRDLERFKPVEMQLVAWAPDLAAIPTPARPLHDAPLARALLDVCFCPSCRQTALAGGVDPDQAARSVRVHVESLLGENAASAAKRVANDEVLGAYLESRRHESASWLRQLAATHHDCTWSILTADSIPEVLTLAPDSALDHLICDGIAPIVQDAEADPQHAKRVESASLTSRLESYGRQMRVWRPLAARADHLVRVVSDAARQCVGPIDFDGLEESPPEVVDWLRQAVRFARRG